MTESIRIAGAGSSPRAQCRPLLLLLLTLLLVGCGSAGGELTGSSNDAGGVRSRVTTSSTAGPVTVELRSGWNAIGLQCQRVTSLTSDPAITGMAVYENGAYQTQSFTVETVNAGGGGRRGLWVFANAATSCTYSGGEDGQGQFVDLASGWNLVSFTNSVDLPGASLSGPVGTMVLPTFQQINADNTLSAVDVQSGGTLRAGRPYWVFASEAARLTVPGPAAPSPTPLAALQALSVNPAQLSVSRYATAQLTALGTFADGSTADLTSRAQWTSSVPSGVAVASNGLVTGLAPGSATVMASLQGFSADAGVTVTDSPPPPQTQPPTQPTVPPAPAVTGVTPAKGPPSGGTTVTLTGTNLAGALAVNFGATAATGVSVNGAGTQLTCTLPAGAAGTVDVRVTTAGGQSANTAVDDFTYVTGPNVLSVTPASGSTAGGTAVTVAGFGFTGATAVTFGTSPATGVLVNGAGTEITCTTPAGTAGTVDVRVTVPPDQTPIVPEDQFTYGPPPTLTSLTPGFGPASAQTAVTITGTNLGGTTAVTFGSTPATGVVVNGAGTQITCDAPALAEARAEVRVTTPFGTTSPASFAYTSFTQQAAGLTTSNLNAAGFLNNLFLAAGTSGTILTSPDGETWSGSASGSTGTLSAVSHGNGSFMVASSSVSSVFTSPTAAGGSWTAQAVPVSLWSLCFGNGFALGGRSGNFQVVGSGATPPFSGSEPLTTPPSAGRGMAFGTGTRCIAVGPGGNRISYSNVTSDSPTWTAIASSPVSDSLIAVCYSPTLDRFLAVGLSGTMALSTDGTGTAWTQVGSGVTSNTLLAAAFGNGYFLAAGESGTILTSPDGTNWTVRPTGRTTNLRGAAISGSRAVVVGDGGLILTL